MFDIGFTEILIVGVVALIVLGPERLPTALRTLGLWVGRIKRTLGSVQKEISDELRVEEMRRAAKEQQEKLESSMETMQRPFHETLREEIIPPRAGKEYVPVPSETTQGDAASPAPNETVEATDTSSNSQPGAKES